MKYDMLLIERSVALYASVEKVLTMHDDWIDGQEGNPKGAYWNAVQDMMELFGYNEDGEVHRNADTIPADCRHVAEQVRVIARKVGNINNGRDPWVPKDYSQFVADLRLLRDRHFPSPDFQRKETVSEMMRAAVPVEHIAKKWGLVDKATGRPLVELVRQEAARPGSVIGSMFPNPDLQRQEYSERFHDLYERADVSFQPRAARREYEEDRKPARQPCPETWQELFDLRPVISIEQLMRMKLCSREEVYAQARLHGAIEHLPTEEMGAAKRALEDKRREHEDRDKEDRKKATEQFAKPEISQDRSGFGKAPEDATEQAAVETASETAAEPAFTGDNGSGLTLDEQIKEALDNGASVNEVKERFGLPVKRITQILKEIEEKEAATANA